ncbi:acyl-CoA thioesterase [Shewanella psychropiezotolerans]|uniref:Acyl-CoA thioesterase n=1 Tax=Shewanella psychropiezotolerans TaxID=2593655 RepID=A0ABX5X5Y7_9GAMM|nr:MULTISPECIES: acyl-CoA thioesterase [Shewanella]MPY26499.1 acyl-CoA thioesterase [Shewanella sp. YLB-07]QDO86162.1 acyl-CoA thioesterase [Shewanella psychropiezotolerans]
MTSMSSKSILTTELEILIPFHDVDSMGITWHGNYLRYFEMARCQLLDLFGYGYREMLASGYSWPIVDLQIKYVQPSTFDQKVKVIASLVEWENRLKINYQVRDLASNKRLTKGYTIQAAVDKNNELCFVTPTVFRQKLAQFIPTLDIDSAQTESIKTKSTEGNGR